MNEKTILAKIFVIDKDGLILTLRRSKTDTRWPLTWDLPGEMVEYGEDPTAAVIRETDEEAGLKIKDPQVFNIYTTNMNSSNKEEYIIRLIYYTFTKDKNVKLSYEHDLFKWVTKEEFLELDAPTYYKQAIAHLPS
jgi:8-oxo-dGTP diphosphatase